MKNLIYGFILAIFLLTGCTTKIQNYSASADNVVKLREFEGVKVGVETFVSSAPQNLFYRGKNGFYCGSVLIPHYVIAPRNEKIEEFMQHAFEYELKTVGIYDKYSKIRIGVEIEGINNGIKGTLFDHSIFLQMTLKIFSTNGNFFKTYISKDYSSSTYFGSVCDDLANSFAQFIQEAIGDIITNPQFPDLLK